MNIKRVITFTGTAEELRLCLLEELEKRIENNRITQPGNKREALAEMRAYEELHSFLVDMIVKEND